LQVFRVQVKHPDNVFFQYTFDGMDRVSSVSESGSSTLLNVEYGTNGKRKRLLRPVAATTTYGFDNADRLGSLSHDFAGTADDYSNVFTYNPAGQIVQLQISNSLYHFGGNSNKVGAYTPNGLNQYTLINGAPVTYDANGNLAFEGSSANTHDMENRLVGTTSPASALTYDPLGRLSEYTNIPASTTQFLFDGDALIAEYTVGGNSATLTRRYVHPLLAPRCSVICTPITKEASSRRATARGPCRRSFRTTLTEYPEARILIDFSTPAKPIFARSVSFTTRRECIRRG
jgi:YD repeat-containing protein